MKSDLPKAQEDTYHKVTLPIPALSSTLNKAMVTYIQKLGAEKDEEGGVTGTVIVRISCSTDVLSLPDLTFTPSIPNNPWFLP